jgi:hypothetical protein
MKNLIPGRRLVGVEGQSVPSVVPRAPKQTPIDR